MTIVELSAPGNLSPSHGCHSRIKKIQIFNRDALNVIERLDDPKTFFYLDPPYPETDQGPYGGYTNQDFKNLVELLKNIEGKFILSFYKKEWMEFPNLWYKFKIKTRTRVNQKGHNQSSNLSKAERYEYIVKNFSD